MGGACSTNLKRRKIYIKHWSEGLKGGDHSEHPGTDRELTPKWVLR